MPRGHEHIPIYSLSINARLSEHFFLRFFQNKIVMGKRSLCSDNRPFPEKYTVKDYIQIKEKNTESLFQIFLKQDSYLDTDTLINEMKRI